MKNKIIKFGLLCAVIILAILGLYKVAKYEVINTAKEPTNLKALNTNTGTLMQGEKDPNRYNYYINTGTFELRVTKKWSLPVYNDFQFYCMQPGGDLEYYGKISYNQAMSLEGRTYYSRCGCAATPSEGKFTNGVFVPIETKDLPLALAYIVSDDPTADNDLSSDDIVGKWSTEKQKGMWNMRYHDFYNSNTGKYEKASGDAVIGDSRSPHDGPSKYDEEAPKYAEYDTKIRGKGLNPSDKTSINDVYTKINQNTKEYTVGPFRMEYINGSYGETTFSGISNMQVVGYNSEGKVVRDNIKVKKVILKDLATGIYGNAKVPEYFEPDENIKVDKTAQVYPTSGQDFQIVFDDPNSGLNENDSNRIAYISIKVKFKYMLANGKYTELNGTRYTIKYSHAESSHIHPGGIITDSEGNPIGSYPPQDCYSCRTTCYLEQSAQQWLMAADAIRSIYEQEVEIANGTLIDTTMDLGGHVWEDVPDGKGNTADGISGILYGGNTSDRAIPNVKVTLYTQDGKVAKLLSNPNEKGISDEQIMHRVNPTYTDSEGNYLFEGLNPMKKYYVTFEYNGQTYLPTEYLTVQNNRYGSVNQMVNAGLYNTSSWKVTSKGTESASDRTNYNEQFKEIGSSPLNYVSSNSLGRLARQEGRYYNETFSQYELMGFVLDENGDYRDSGIALVDGFFEIRNGNIVKTDTLQEGIISREIRKFVETNRRSPNENDLIVIYTDIARRYGNSQELWKKLQFIEDCKIVSYTQAQDSRNYDLYPVYNQFRINHARNNEVYKAASAAQNGNYEMHAEVLDGVVYNPIYPGQFFVNQGLWRRQEADLALRKDIAYAATRINGKTEVYKYDKRLAMTDEERAELARLYEEYNKDRGNKDKYNAYIEYELELENKHYWEIQLRMRDYNNYYASNYTRELYKADYNYRSALTNKAGESKELELYVTYKITIRNNSESILSEVKEIVDYYDKDYTYRDDLSWVMYKANSNNGIDELIVTEDDYYNTIHNLTRQGNIATYNKGTSTRTASTYGNASHSDMESKYNSVYIGGLANKKLASGEEAYVYLTFAVNKENNKIITDNDDSLKQNYVEINGYTTYYRDGTKLPNDQIMNSRDAAGLIDINSNPGNLSLSDLQGDKYEKNFENDTDRAKSIKVTVKDDFIRSINGNVWEDQRTVKASDSIIGDGVRQDSEVKIQGVTVELVEKLADGKEYVWARTTTDANGKYEFKAKDGSPYIIPGNYIVRFKYGDTEKTVKTNASGGSNTVSYNGQDFKSTIYQKDAKNGNEVSGYKDNYYDIQKADASSNMSDAKDVWGNTTTKGTRQYVNNWSNNGGNGVTNNRAEILASPYTTPVNNNHIKELIENANMTAETAIIVLEGEYNRVNTDGYYKDPQGNTVSNNKDKYLYGNDINGNYTLNNVDLGLTERPKAQLELSKKITNVKVTLANGNTLFDATKGTTDLAWNIKNSKYELNKSIKDGKYNEYYKTNHRYAYRTEVDKLVASKYKNGSNGLIQITMDEELMHGATIKITYELAVTNVGETDYEGQDFYYKATGANTKVTTSSDVVIDYVANNLQYRQNDNNGWKAVRDVVSAEGLNSNLTDAAAKYNTIIKTEGLKGALKPGDSKTAGLVLTQTITPENTADDKTYDNIAEITKISNSVGRRMAYSIQGNQNPTTIPQEVDSVKSERVVILPPFGIGNIVVYISLAIGVLAILIGGIVFIKKKVINK